MTPCRPRRRADRGAGPVTVIMVLAILALVFTISVTAVFAVAGGERSGAMHAADAAALAGARGVLDQAPADVAPGFVTPAEIPTMLGGGVCVQTGRVDAFRLAAANNAALTSYCYNVFTDTVRVAVRMNDFNVGSGPATATAEAATTFQAASCVLDPGFTPPSENLPSSTPTPNPVPTPAPNPNPIHTFVDCGFGGLAVIFRFPEERFFFVDLARELDARDPRLTR
jgi:hypothetical protein